MLWHAEQAAAVTALVGWIASCLSLFDYFRLLISLFLAIVLVASSIVSLSCVAGRNIRLHCERNRVASVVQFVIGTICSGLCLSTNSAMHLLIEKNNFLGIRAARQLLLQ